MAMTAGMRDRMETGMKAGTRKADGRVLTEAFIMYF